MVGYCGIRPGARITVQDKGWIPKSENVLAFDLAKVLGERYV